MPIFTPVPPAKRRVLHLSDKGKDVLAYQRMVKRTLSVLGLVSLNRQSSLFGQGTLKDTLLLQHHMGGYHPTGFVDAATWTAVDPQMHAYERWLLRAKPKPPAPIGNRIAHQLEVMYILRLDFYTQKRPGATAVPQPWKKGADCSLSYLLARAIALGEKYDGYGNTGTIWANYAHVDEKDLRNGDAVLYGRNGVTTHVQGVVDASIGMTVGFGNAPGTRANLRYRPDVMGFRRGA